MPICRYCGEEIEFRHVNGVLSPIHINRNWCQSAVEEPWVKEKSTGSTSFQDFCRPTKCPKCQKPVYFVRHNGGSVWVDELGWPWPKHPCMEKEIEPKWYIYIKEKTTYENNQKYFCGVAIFSHRINKSPSRILLAIDGGKLGKVIISTEANTRAKYLQGAFVVVKFKEAIIALSTHDRKPLYDWALPPELMGLPKTWPTITKENNVYS